MDNEDTADMRNVADLWSSVDRTLRVHVPAVASGEEAGFWIINNNTGEAMRLTLDDAADLSIALHAAATALAQVTVD